MKWMPYIFLCSQLCAGTWSDVDNLFPGSGNEIDEYNVGLDARGQGLAVYFDTTADILYFRVWNGSEWGVQQTLYDASANLQDVALSMNATGQALLTATNSSASPDEVYGWYYNGTSWSAREVLTTNGHDSSVALGDNGFGVCVWETATVGGIFSKRFQNGSWDASATELTTGDDDFDSGYVVVNNNSQACAIWDLDTDGGGNHIVQTARYRNGSWTSPRNLTDGSVDAQLPENWSNQPIAINDNGCILAAWTLSDDGDDIATQAAFFNGTRWETTQTVFDAASDGPAVCLNNENEGFIVFDIDEDGIEGVGAVKCTNGTFATYERIVESTDVTYARVRNIDQGGALAVYQKDSGLSASVYNGYTWDDAQEIVDEDVNNNYPILQLSTNGTGVTIIKSDDDESLYTTFFTPASLNTLPQTARSFQQKGDTRFMWTPQVSMPWMQVLDREGNDVLGSFRGEVSGGVLRASLYKGNTYRLRGLSAFNQVSGEVEVSTE